MVFVLDVIKDSFDDCFKLFSDICFCVLSLY